MFQVDLRYGTGQLDNNSKRELLSAILVNHMIYYSIQAGSGINYSEHGWLRDDGVNLIVVDAEGNELPYQGEGEW
jgi:hypothetical protein